MPAGRPTDYNQALADAICERIGVGESLRSVCRDPAMPVMSAVFRWLTIHSEFKEQYREAKAQSAEALFDEMMDIADEGEDAVRDRLRVDTRKWVLSRLNPKKYGDHIQADVNSRQTVTHIHLIAPGEETTIPEEDFQLLPHHTEQ